MSTEKMRDLLREYIEYRDGNIYWLKTIGSKAKAGAKIGSPDRQGYLRFWMFRKQYSAHRAIFLMLNGYLPRCIDHINGAVDDNRIKICAKQHFLRTSSTKKEGQLVDLVLRVFTGMPKTTDGRLASGRMENLSTLEALPLSRRQRMLGVLPQKTYMGNFSIPDLQQKNS